MGKKVKVKTKTTVSTGKKKPVKPNFTTDGGLLTEKIIVTVTKSKEKKNEKN